MNLKTVVPGVYAISLGIVNVFLLDGEQLTLIDAGVAGSEVKILQAVRQLGRQPRDLAHILITHPHADHVGGLAALQQATGAQVSMHELDAAVYRQGTEIRRVQPSTGLLSRVMVAFINRSIDRQPAGPGAPPNLARIDHCLKGGEELPLAGGLTALHTPGHTAGHLCFLWPREGGVLFAGDAASHMLRLGFSFLYEDFDQGRRTLRSLAELQFETVCFAHGSPITPAAAAQLKRRFGNQ